MDSPGNFLGMVSRSAKQRSAWSAQAGARAASLSVYRKTDPFRSSHPNFHAVLTAEYPTPWYLDASGAAQDARWVNVSGAAQDARWVNVSGEAQDARCFVYPDQFHPNVAPHALEAEWREPSGDSCASQHRAVCVTGPRAF
jgi:hypothetical protein